MELVHYGSDFPVPVGRNSLVFEVDGQLMGFERNDDNDGVFYDVSFDQLQYICAGTKVLVQIIGLNGPFEKAFTWENKVFFQKFLHDPQADGTPQPTPTQDQIQNKIPNTWIDYEGLDETQRREHPIHKKRERAIPLDATQ
jgi:hypothetical protein